MNVEVICDRNRSKEKEINNTNPKMSEAPAVTKSPAKAKSPLKSRQEILGYFYGQPLESFDNLLEVQSQPSSSTSSANHFKIKPTNLDIIRHWMFLEDQNKNRTTRTISNSVNDVTDNLIQFYTKYHPSVELR